MLTQIIFFIMLSTGSVFCAAVSKKRYEEILPITVSSIVVILFLAGICKNLKNGVYFVCILAAGMYFVSGYYILKKRILKSFLKNIFTPAFFIYFILFFLLSFYNRGKLLMEWDEFSHWGDIVKVMTTLDDFGTSPISHSLFQSYPPGMSLFQYFLQKINSLICSGKAFSEWRLYFAYQIFGVSFFIPFLKQLSYKRLLVGLVSIFTIFGAPLLFYNEYYTSIYIDPILGILTGTGLAMIYTNMNKDSYYVMNILLTCSMLVLAKDAGMLFAIIIAILFCIDWFAGQGWKIKERKNIVKNGVFIVGLVCSLLLPKVLWSSNIKLNNAAKSFSQPIEWNSLINVILGRDTSYRMGVWKSFYRALISYKVDFGNTEIAINYIVLLVVSISFIYMLLQLFKEKKKYAQNRVFIGTVMAMTGIYLVGLCITYMYKFVEYEAEKLASFSRYVNIVFLAIWIVILILMLVLMQRVEEKNRKLAVGLICLVLVVSPLEEVYDFTNGEYIKDAAVNRQSYEAVSENIVQIAGEQSKKIYLIAQESSGYDWYVIRYNVRPHYVANVNGWSIGEPYYDGDIWTKQFTAEEWLNILIKEYDYVALYKINDYFLQNYSSVFYDANEIQENAVYFVNKETKLLKKCK